MIKRRHITGALRILAGMFVGITLYANFGPEPSPEYRVVKVPVEVLVKGEPDTVIRWREKIVYRTVRAETRATADSGAAPTVTAFCKPSIMLAVGSFGTTDPENTSSPTAGNPALVRSAAYNGKKLELWEARSNGDLTKETFKVRAPWRFSMGDSAIVQGARFWWLDDALKAAAVFGAGYLAGKL